MNEQTKNDYIKYRLEKSFEGLNDAKLLAQDPDVLVSPDVEIVWGGWLVNP